MVRLQKANIDLIGSKVPSLQYNDMLLFYAQCKGEIHLYVDSESKPKDEKEITPIQKYTFFRLMLVNAYPFNTHALGFILKLKLNNKYDFDIATDHYRLLSMLEYIEFNKVFTINIDTDPRLTTKGKVLDSH